MEERRPVYLDSCSVDRLAEEGFDPVSDLESTEFEIALTPDLKRECELSSERAAPPAARDLHRRITSKGAPRGLFGFGRSSFGGFDEGVWASPEQRDTLNAIKTAERPRNPIPRNRTDAHLVALAQDAIVLAANDRQSHWHKELNGKGQVIFWHDFLPVLCTTGNVAAAIRRFLFQA